MEKTELQKLTRKELYQLITDLQEELRRYRQIDDDTNHYMNSLKESEEKYRILLDESSDPIFAFASDGEYLYVNKAFADGVGKPIDKIIHKRIWDVFSKEEADKRYTVVKWVFEHGETKVIEVRVPREDGDRFYITTVKPVFGGDGKVTSVICISKEITDRKRIEEELLHLSTHDILTGLYNRNFFEVELDRLQVSRNFPVSIVIADMDYLKGINDSFGHAAGDAILKKAANCMKKVFRAEDILARIGGDEFAVLLPGTDLETAREAVLRLKRVIKETGDPHLRLSIGIACSGPEGDLNEVMRIADDRMYQEKLNHRTQIL
jgi:diguanylate cyclase (GGDEF)-like protein/PAS domain S-box-containing protein